jgi:hypothetical protein
LTPHCPLYTSPRVGAPDISTNDVECISGDTVVRQPPGTENKLHLAVAHWRAGNRQEAKECDAEVTHFFAKIPSPHRR